MTNLNKNRGKRGKFLSKVCCVGTVLWRLKLFDDGICEDESIRSVLLIRRRDAESVN